MAQVVLGTNTDFQLQAFLFTVLTLCLISLTIPSCSTEEISLRLFTFTSVPIPQQAFGVGTETFNIMHGGSSSSATHTVSGDGLCQAGGGLGLRQTWTVPQLFRGWVVEGSGHTDWGWVGTGADKSLCVIGVSRTAAVLSQRMKVPQGHRVIAGFGRVYHHCVRVFLGQRLFAGT